MRAVSRPHTRDIWLWAEPKRTAVVRCGVQAVRSRVARYRTRKVEEGQHIVGDGAVARLICFAIPRPIAVWVETLDTWGEVRRCVGHQGGGLGCERGVRCQFRLYIPSTRCRLAARPDSIARSLMARDDRPRDAQWKNRETDASARAGTCWLCGSIPNDIHRICVFRV